MSFLHTVRSVSAMLIGALLLTTAASAQTTWYVDDDAPNDPGPGDVAVSDPLEDGSLDHPFDAIQEGIDVALGGDTVLVADGAYSGLGNRNIDYHGKALTVRSESGPETCIIDCAQDGRGFEFHSGEGADSALAGFTITNAYAPYLTGTIRCAYNSSPTLVDCILTGNSVYDGGGLYCYESASPTLIGCTITANSAEIYGAVCCRYGSNPTLVNCAITGNSAYMGAGLLCHNESSPTLVGCIIATNTADNSGGGVSSTGASDPTLVCCVITANSAYYHGGGVRCLDADATLVNCAIQGNTAYIGAGVSCYTSNMSLTNCLITDNSAEMIGGGILCSHGSVLTSTNCTVVRNSGPNGAELACYSDGQDDPSQLVIRGCILYSTLWSWLFNHDSSAISATYTDTTPVWTGEGNIDADPLFVDLDGPDDDPNTWEDNDYHLGPGSPCIDAADNTAVPADTVDLDGDGDTAEPTPFDCDGRLRFANRIDTPDTGNPDPNSPDLPIVDMGAYEFQCTGDLGGDGQINLADLAQLLGSYGETSGVTYQDGDLDRDGDVDLADLAALLGVYGTTCE
jgi:hypothetical protein